MAPCVDSIDTMPLTDSTIASPGIAPAADRSPPACFACGSTRSSFWLSHGGFDLHRCDECGLAGVSPIPDERTLAAVYDETYLTEGGAFGYQDDPDKLVAQKTRQIRDRRALLASIGYSGRRALDLGCGDGWWLESLAEDHDEVVGIEPMPAVRAAAAQRLHAGRLLAGLSHLGSDERFDLITAFDVLEHLPDPWNVLQELTGRLAPGGLLCLVLPIADHWTARHMPEQWDQIKPPEHLWYFTRESLRRVTQKLGLETRVEASAWIRWPRPIPHLPQILQAPFRLPMKLLARISPSVECGLADSLLWCAQKRGG